MADVFEGESGFDLSDEGLAARFAAQEGQESNGSTAPEISPPEGVSTEQAPPEESNPEPKEESAISTEQAADKAAEQLKNANRGMTQAMQRAAALTAENQMLGDTVKALQAELEQLRSVPAAPPPPETAASLLEAFASDPEGFLNKQVQRVLAPELEAMRRREQERGVVAEIGKVIPTLRKHWGAQVESEETLTEIVKTAISYSFFKDQPGQAMRLAALSLLNEPQPKVDQSLIDEAYERGKRETAEEFQRREQAKAAVPPIAQPYLNKEPLSLEDQIKQEIFQASPSVF